jgi:AcrR family transcriptional regulator
LAGRNSQARTRLARRAVVDSARALFVDRGYAQTTIEAISDLSDVPQATIYRLFSSKLGILRALLDVSIAGDDEEVAVQDRPGSRALIAEEDPRILLSGFAGVCRDINARAGIVYQILVSAAGSDPEAAPLLADYTRKRSRGQGQIADALARAGKLRPELKGRDAADIIHVLMSPEVYRLLVVDRGWKPGRYEQWLRTTLIEQLLPGPVEQPRTAPQAAESTVRFT